MKKPVSSSRHSVLDQEGDTLPNKGEKFLKNCGWTKLNQSPEGVLFTKKNSYAFYSLQINPSDPIATWGKVDNSLELYIYKKTFIKVWYSGSKVCKFSAEPGLHILPNAFTIIVTK